jgi:hypothetical protein
MENTEFGLKIKINDEYHLAVLRSKSRRGLYTYLKENKGKT